ncbi:hypothetical protein [Metapseudomonas resinovorans]|uniref:Uncharacterized protein n=1 Tax=Metapseudomonas resinovorans NBRC 106553 TaxID=1245471 RepID=S6AHR7_METRE|nr:hypothetical protein [Pseudomonas resinovorans]BAN50107.1 hypothetical protein PCA10_43750 [Pseudomonas resinovorans NBRC 106553]
MNSISISSPLASYLGLAAKPQAATTQGKPENTESAPQDPIAEIRRFANALVEQGRGGLLRAMNGGGEVASASPVADSGQTSGSDTIELPDVAELDREDALALKDKVQKLIDLGLDKSTGFIGYNGEQQTDSLATYRDWLQARGGISVYA